MRDKFRKIQTTKIKAQKISEVSKAKMNLKPVYAHPGFGWNRVSFLPRSWYGALFCI